MSSKCMNRVFLMGHLGQQPELMTSKAGKSYTRLNVATNRRWSDPEGEAKESTDWHSVFVWGPLAERCTEHLRKGALVFVEGSLTYWQVATGEGNPYKNAIHGHEVRFLSHPRTPLAPVLGENLDNSEEARNHNAVAHL